MIDMGSGGRKMMMMANRVGCWRTNLCVGGFRVLGLILKRRTLSSWLRVFCVDRAPGPSDCFFVNGIVGEFIYFILGDKTPSVFLAVG